MAEKNPAAYARIVEKYELRPDSTWMVGNSPKSDINPALAAGCTPSLSLTATHGFWSTKSSTPHRRNRSLLIVGRFAELREHF